MALKPVRSATSRSPDGEERPSLHGPSPPGRALQPQGPGLHHGASDSPPVAQLETLLPPGRDTGPSESLSASRPVLTLVSDTPTSIHRGDSGHGHMTVPPEALWEAPRLGLARRALHACRPYHPALQHLSVNQGQSTENTAHGEATSEHAGGPADSTGTRGGPADTTGNGGPCQHHGDTGGGLQMLRHKVRSRQ